MLKLRETLYVEMRVMYCDAQSLSTGFVLVNNGLSDEALCVHQNQHFVFSFYNEIELIQINH